jgi:ADP-ribose pyrophosphatase YjhB (NUDIX family)
MVSGAVEKGEFFSNAREREVAEETSVEAHFTGVLGMSNHVSCRWGNNEVVMFCKCEAQPTDVNMRPTPRRGEIEAGKWVHIQNSHK